MFLPATTNRGFETLNFTDVYHMPCSLRQSSMIGDYEDAMDRPGSSAIWFNEAHLNREMAYEVGNRLVNWSGKGVLFEEAPDPFLFAIPSDYKAVGYRRAKEGEKFLSEAGYVLEATHHHNLPTIILESI